MQRYSPSHAFLLISLLIVLYEPNSATRAIVVYDLTSDIGRDTEAAREPILEVWSNDSEIQDQTPHIDINKIPLCFPYCQYGDL